MKRTHIVMLVAIAFSTSSYVDAYFDISKNIEIFTTVFRQVNTYYVDEITPSDVMEQGIYSMLNNLDPYTVYYPEGMVGL